MSYPPSNWQQDQPQPQHSRPVQRRTREPMSFWQTVGAVVVGLVLGTVIIWVLTLLLFFLGAAALFDQVSDSGLLEDSGSVGSGAGFDCETGWLKSDATDYEKYAAENC